MTGPVTRPVPTKPTKPAKSSERAQGDILQAVLPDRCSGKFGKRAVKAFAA